MEGIPFWLDWITYIFVLASKTHLQSCHADLLHKSYLRQTSQNAPPRQWIQMHTASMTFIGRKRLEFFQTSDQQSVKETSSTGTCVAADRYQLTTLLGDYHRLCHLPHWFHKQQRHLGWSHREPAYVKGCVQQCWDSDNPHQMGKRPVSIVLNSPKALLIQTIMLYVTINPHWPIIHVISIS